VKDMVLVPQIKDQVVEQQILHGMTLEWVYFSLKKIKLWVLSLQGMNS
jgi:hypothetical protein